MGIKLSKYSIEADKEVLAYVNARGWSISDNFLFFTGINVKTEKQILKDLDNFEKKYKEILKCIHGMKKKIKAKKKKST